MSTNPSKHNDIRTSRELVALLTRETDGPTHADGERLPENLVRPLSGRSEEAA